MFKILGVKVDEINLKEAILIIEKFIKSGKAHQVVTVNPEIIMATQIHSAYREILNDSDLNVPDGVGLILAAKLRGRNIKGRVTGVDLVYELAKYNHSIFFLGGQNNVAQQTADVLTKSNPNIKVAGFDQGGEVGEDGKVKEKVLDKIKKAKPDILLVAFGHPKQEFFIDRYKNELKIPISIGIGGTFDYISGKVSRAPLWMQDLGLEWLFRLFVEPKRWRRIYTAVIKFPWAFIRETMKKDEPD